MRRGIPATWFRAGQGAERQRHRLLCVKVGGIPLASANPKGAFHFPIFPVTQTSRLSFIPGRLPWIMPNVPRLYMLHSGKAAEPIAMCGEPYDVNPFLCVAVSHRKQ